MIRKAVIPAAGFGTRLLPASKSQPKEMLPIVDTPTIQYVVEEAVAAGITDILMIIGKGKRAIEEHFYRNFELEYELEEKGKLKELESIKRISELADVHFIWQKELNGLGDAIRYARYHVGDEPFAVLLGDTLVKSNTADSVTKQMIDVYERFNETVVALEQVPQEKVSRYGVMDGRLIDKNVFLVNSFVEKPKPDEAPSNMVIAGRYVFNPEIFDCIDKTKPGKNNEIQLTDAMQLLLKERAMYGLLFDGRRYDLGNLSDFIKTNIEFALMRDDLKDDLESFIKELASKI